MAMTKKERAEFDEAILRAKTVAALRWTAPVETDLPVPSGSDMTSGWDYNQYSSPLRVYEAWSQSFRHGDGRKPNGISAQQNGIALFSTKLRALRALRHAVEMSAAEKLLKIDAMIEQEEAAQGASK